MKTEYFFSQIWNKKTDKILEIIKKIENKWKVYTGKKVILNLFKI